MPPAAVWPKTIAQVATIVKPPARLRPSDFAFICGMRLANFHRMVIQKSEQKTNDKHPTLLAVDAVLAKEKRNSEYIGEDPRAGGKPRAILSAQAKQRCHCCQ